MLSSMPGAGPRLTLETHVRALEVGGLETGFQGIGPKETAAEGLLALLWILRVGALGGGGGLRHVSRDLQ